MQCAELAHRSKIEERTYGALGLYKADSWSNHYSAKYQRCFVQIDFRHVMPMVDKTAPHLVVVLLDAIENREVAAFTSTNDKDAQAAYCTITDGDVRKEGDCYAAMTYMNDRMSD
jgi:hypothetical protein